MTLKEAWANSNKKMKAMFVLAGQGLILDIIIALYVAYKVFG